MDILGSILEKWNKDKDIESLISAGLFENQSAIQSSLEKLSGQQRDYAFTVLEDIQRSIQDYIAKMESEKNTVQIQIDTTRKSEKACLSYGSSIDIQKNKKE